MKHLSNIGVLIILLAFSKSYGQANSCDTIYSITEVPPRYHTDKNGLIQYVRNELIPIIGLCVERESELIYSLFIKLTIDCNGNVIDATFSKANLTIKCKEEVKAKLLTMTGWTAGQQGGKNVCCKYFIPISCIYWSHD